VIADLGADPESHPALKELRRLATRCKEVMLAGDFQVLGSIMTANTDVQRTLHPDLVCRDFEQIIATARRYDCLGCKVNGAGGDGGSITILTDGDMRKKRRMIEALQEDGYSHLPVYLSRLGLRVW
jgi:D-glycero-alpha-D-manno-heptose-7-phosphate kinase